MTFLAPVFLYAAIAASIAVVVLHLIITHRPRARILPTARFIPDAPSVAPSRAVRPSDLLLLVLRVLLLIAVGAALARPVITPAREHVARVILADVSWSPASLAEVHDSVTALFRPGDVMIPFDSAPRAAMATDSVPLQRAAHSVEHGSLSAAVVAAIRAGSQVRTGSDSIEMVVVSPFGAAERDDATDSIRALWPGRARTVLVRSAASASSIAPRLFWPNLQRPPMASARARVDTVGAVVMRGDVTIAPFQRQWMFSADSLRGARVIARWVDGEPAAVEVGADFGCVRSIAIRMDDTGDLPLHPDIRKLRARLTAPCGTQVTATDTALMRRMAGAGALAPSTAFPAPANTSSPVAPWLLGVAIVLALIELIVRRGRTEVQR